jgi:hypothetical protein
MKNKATAIAIIASSMVVVIKKKKKTMATIIAVLFCGKFCKEEGDGHFNSNRHPVVVAFFLSGKCCKEEGDDNRRPLLLLWLLLQRRKR